MKEGAELIARARLICGEQHVLTHPSVLSTYRSDGMRRDGPLPLAAILPGSAAEVVSVVTACAETEVPFVVRGAGTGRSGGALPVADGVLLVLTRLRQTLSAESGEVTVQAGAPVSALPPLSSGSWLAAAQPLGTVGGYLAECGAGADIVALDLVRPDGRLVRLDSRQSGYDLTGAFGGSRGRVGVAVTITLRAMRR